MFRFLAIVRDNNATFYDYSSCEPVGIRLRIAVTVIAALFLAAGVKGDLSSFLEGVITVQSILIGFSFSVMFFLVSNGEIVKEFEEESIENKIRRKKLNKLAEEIFYNISYFNLVAMGCLFSSLLLLIPDVCFIIPPSLRAWGAQRVEYIIFAIEYIQITLKFFVSCAFYFLLLESGFTFGRTVGRVNFLFSQKILPP